MIRGFPGDLPRETVVLVGFGLGTLLYIAVILAILTLARLRRGARWRDYVAWRPFRPDWVYVALAIAGIVWGVGVGSVIEALHGLDQNVLIQKFIREAKGADVRALVVGNRVVAAMRRQAGKGEFRSNLHRGGKAEAVKLAPATRRMAVAAARVLGLQVAGVDLLESNAGPLVMEVNSSPGLEGIEAATGVDVAGAIMDLLHVQVGNAAPGGRMRRGILRSI